MLPGVRTLVRVQENKESDNGLDIRSQPKDRTEPPNSGSGLGECLKRLSRETE